jgi:TIR domain-containing protein
MRFNREEAVVRKLVFLSYSRTDAGFADEIELALKGCQWDVFRDDVSISPGDLWETSIDIGLKKADAMIILVSAASSLSQWVTYEYAFATGAEKPVIAVVLPGSQLPLPIRKYQSVFYPGDDAVEQIDKGLRNQVNRARRASESAPTLMAKFYENDGKVRRSRATLPVIDLELWVVNAPSSTAEVAFEILEEVNGRKWSVKRTPAAVREFLTDQRFGLWGDVDIWARGTIPGGEDWTTSSRLYEALLRYYEKNPASADVQKALRQIRDN